MYALPYHPMLLTLHGSSQLAREELLSTGLTYESDL